MIQNHSSITCLGKSIGLALVKFYSVEDATRCLQDYPVIDIRGDPAWLEAGFEHSNEDWRCFRCRAVNLPRRRFCFKCNERRRDDAEPEKETEIDLTMLPGADDLSPQPTSFILIQSIGNSTAAEVSSSLCNYILTFCSCLKCSNHIGSIELLLCKKD